MNSDVRGRCECGNVDFRVKSPRKTVTVCHCSQCRRTSGHQWASTHAPYDQLTFIKKEGLEWYASSDTAKRGFCKCCRSSLFYGMNDEDGIGIAAGCIESPSGLVIGKHIFAASKGDYYEISGEELQLNEC